tara:strand:+ start:967 stop:1467 length:501 start_codon:yes stop_codon:yes gene_type:complete
MHIDFTCPGCQKTHRVAFETDSQDLTCPACQHRRAISSSAWHSDHLAECLACGEADLWRQKDFPQAIGIGLVILGALLSTVAWAWYRPAWAIGILMLFALLDLALYSLMSDVLVCYRCQARHRLDGPTDSYERFNHERAERYRQEALRRDAQPSGHDPNPEPPASG